MVVTGDMNEFREAVQTVVALGLSSSLFTFIRGAHHTTPHPYDYMDPHAQRTPNPSN